MVYYLVPDGLRRRTNRQDTRTGTGRLLFPGMDAVSDQWEEMILALMNGLNWI